MEAAFLDLGWKGVLLEYYVPFPSLDDLALYNRFGAKRSLLAGRLVLLSQKSESERRGLGR